MLRIRITEEQVAEKYADHEMRCPIHLSIGQEGPSAAFALVAALKDYAVSTHRAHAHFLAKGGQIDELVAELHGKTSGCSKGAGGSMHLADGRVGFMGSSAIVGNSIPVGVGLGLSLKASASDAVSWVFLGEAATEEGVFYESLNYAAVAELPVIFVCENNGFSVYTDETVRRPNGFEVTELAKSLGCESIKADGNDAVQCLEMMDNARKRVAGSHGPVLLEFSVFRQREHCGPNFDDDLAYREPDYIANGFQNDPIKILLASDKGGSLAQLAAQYSQQIHLEVASAFEKAKESAWLTGEEASGLVYA